MQNTIFDDLSCAQFDCLLMTKIADIVDFAAGRNPPENMQWAIQMMTEYVNNRALIGDEGECSEEYENVIQNAVLDIIYELPETPDVARAVAAAIHPDITALSATVTWMPDGHSAKSWAAMLAEIGGLLEAYARTAVKNEAFETLARAIPGLQYPC